MVPQPLHASPEPPGMGKNILLWSVKFSYTDSQCSGFPHPIYSNLIGKKVIPRTLVKCCHFRCESVMVMMSLEILKNNIFFSPKSMKLAYPLEVWVLSQ